MLTLDYDFPISTNGEVEMINYTFLYYVFMYVTVFSFLPVAYWIVGEEEENDK